MLTEKQLRNYWAKVDVKGEDECWNWIAYKTKKGYGGFKYANGAIGQCHRISAYLAGLIPNIKSQSDNDQVLHTCDNPACQNPKHFFIGSNKDNMDDRDRKGRQVRGEKANFAKLTEEDVIEIRRFYAQGGISQRSLARIYKVNQSSIGRIILKHYWAHI